MSFDKHIHQKAVNRQDTQENISLAHKAPCAFLIAVSALPKATAVQISSTVN